MLCTLPGGTGAVTIDSSLALPSAGAAATAAAVAALLCSAAGMTCCMPPGTFRDSSELALPLEACH